MNGSIAITSIQSYLKLTVYTIQLTALRITPKLAVTTVDCRLWTVDYYYNTYFFVNKSTDFLLTMIFSEEFRHVANFRDELDVIKLVSCIIMKHLASGGSSQQVLPSF